MRDLILNLLAEASSRFKPELIDKAVRAIHHHYWETRGGLPNRDGVVNTPDYHEAVRLEFGWPEPVYNDYARERVSTIIAMLHGRYHPMNPNEHAMDRKVIESCERQSIPRVLGSSYNRMAKGKQVRDLIK